MTAYTAPSTPKPTDNHADDDNRTEKQYLIDTSNDYLRWKGVQYKKVNGIGFVDGQHYVIKMEQELGVRMKVLWGEADNGHEAIVTRAQTKFDMD